MNTFSFYTASFCLKMEDFTNIELADMHFCYGLADGDGARARRLYQQRHPNRVLPHHDKFRKIHSQLRENGKFYTRDSSRPARERPVRNLEREEEVLDQVGNDASISTREITRRTGISQSTVWRILKDQQLYPFHLQKVQNLLPGDYARRLDYCTLMRERIRRDDHLLRKILFTDESLFTREGTFNSHNMHSWDEEHPHATFVRSHQYRFSLNVWCGIMGNHLIGPYFIEGRLTGEAYVNFLQNHLNNFLEDVSLTERRNMWFMHDGAPPHTARITRNYLDERFPNRWIGINGPVQWPPRSPGLNMMDYYFWGHLKDYVYKETIRDVDHLRQRIIDGCHMIRNNSDRIFPEVRHNMIRRIDLCIRFEGGHFEPFL